MISLRFGLGAGSLRSCFFWAPALLVSLLACSRGSSDTGDADDSSDADSTADQDDGAATGGGSGDLPDYSDLPRGRARAGGAFVHLFEWKWTDVALECENFLGPHGFAAVQISPANAHAKLAGAPWYERYQPAGYEIESRSGTRAEFEDMVTRCDAAGVDIYVDAVINHMTAQASGTNTAGNSFTKYEYTDIGSTVDAPLTLYTEADFHLPACDIEGSDYASNADDVRNCELVGLSDLRTEAENVRDRIATYLADYVDLGVRGFRIDAAKHMPVADVAAIIQLVSEKVGQDRAPYFFLEVIDNGAEAISASDYLDVAGDSGSVIDITEFKYESAFDKFLPARGETLDSLADVNETTWSLLPTDRAVVFTNNHDTQRGDAIFYQDGAHHDLANVYLLANPYGYPQLMSSYAFSRANTGKGPPSDSAGNTNSIYLEGADAPSCIAPGDLSQSSGWVCEHRSAQVAAMVGFRLATAGEAVANYWSNDANQIAFGRGDAGFVVINGEDAVLTQTLSTGLPEGEYCDLLSGGRQGESCLGTQVSVNAAGQAEFEVAALTAVALTREARVP